MTYSYVLLLKPPLSIGQESKHPVEESKKKRGHVPLPVQPKDGPCSPVTLSQRINGVTRRVYLSVWWSSSLLLRKTMMETLLFILCNTSRWASVFFPSRNKNKPGCANKPRKLEGRKEQLARQLWKTNNSGNEEGTENASQREDVGRDLQKIGKNQKV